MKEGACGADITPEVARAKSLRVRFPAAYFYPQYRQYRPEGIRYAM
jgi:hypothetical protein